MGPILRLSFHQISIVCFHVLVESTFASGWSLLAEVFRSLLDTVIVPGWRFGVQLCTHRPLLESLLYSVETKMKIRRN